MRRIVAIASTIMLVIFLRGTVHAQPAGFERLGLRFVFNERVTSWTMRQLTSVGAVS